MSTDYNAWKNQPENILFIHKEGTPATGPIDVTLNREHNMFKGLFLREVRIETASSTTDPYWNVRLTNTSTGNAENINFILRNDNLIGYPILLENSNLMLRTYSPEIQLVTGQEINFRNFSIAITDPAGDAASFNKISFIFVVR